MIDEDDYTYLLDERRERRLNRSNSIKETHNTYNCVTYQYKSSTFQNHRSKQDSTEKQYDWRNSCSSGSNSNSRWSNRGKNISIDNKKVITVKQRSKSQDSRCFIKQCAIDVICRKTEAIEDKNFSIGNLNDSPKWSIIKRKFEQQSSESENEFSVNDKITISPTTTIVPTVRTPQLQRKTYHNSLLSSSSMSNLTMNNVSSSSQSSLSSSFTSSPSSSSSCLQRTKSIEKSSKTRLDSFTDIDDENVTKVSLIALKFQSIKNNTQDLKLNGVNQLKSIERNSKEIERKQFSKYDFDSGNESEPLSVKERILFLEKIKDSVATRLDESRKEFKISPSTTTTTSDLRKTSIQRKDLIKTHSLDDRSPTINGHQLNSIHLRSNSVPATVSRRLQSSNDINKVKETLLNSQLRLNLKNNQHPPVKPRKFSLPNQEKKQSLNNLDSINNDKSRNSPVIEENLYESLFSLQPSILNKKQSNDDVSVHSDELSIYSDSSSYSSGYYETSSGHIKSSQILPTPPQPPPLPPRRNENLIKGSDLSGNDICKEKISLAEEIIDIYNAGIKEGTEEDHIYQSIYERISDENTNECSNKSINPNWIPKSENEEMLKKLIVELQKIVVNVKRVSLQRSSSTASDSVSIGNSFRSLSNKRSNSSCCCSESESTSSSSTRLSKQSIESAEQASPQQQQQQQQQQIEQNQEQRQSHQENDYQNFHLNRKSEANNSLIHSIIDSTSDDLRKFLFSSSSGKRFSILSTSSSEPYITPNTPANNQQRTNVNLLEEENNIFPFTKTHLNVIDQISSSERYVEFNEVLKSPLDEQPLYQFYDKDVKRREALMVFTEYSSSSPSSEIDDYYLQCCSSIYSNDDIYNNLKPTAITTSPLTPTQGNEHQVSTPFMDMIISNGFRRLWCEVPQVKETGLHDRLSPQERKLQEALFEVITSEASYLRSLNVLVNHFYKSTELTSNSEILDERKKRDLFSNIDDIFLVTKNLFKNLEKIWEENIHISVKSICELVNYFGEKYFSAYVNYCKYQMNQERILKDLQERNKFNDILKRLECNACCQGLSILSFLLLPMQRITRYPLLFDAILSRLEVNTNEYDVCRKTLITLNKIVQDCNLAARQFERWHELTVIERKLRFLSIKKFPLVSSARFLLKKGDVTRLKPEYQTQLLIGAMSSKTPNWSKAQNYLILFNDLLLITKRKSDDQYNVYDYCERNLVNILVINNGCIGGSNVLMACKPPENFKFLVQLTLLYNHIGKNVVYYFNFLSENDRLRWIEAIEPPKSENPNEKIYEEWDCPQVICEKRYVSQQPDELSIEEADVINVFRKSANDWYEGERIRDGARGWFPASHIMEIANKHARARNLRIRHRLILLTETILEKTQQQQKKK